jgi:hypothetical protein
MKATLQNKLFVATGILLAMAYTGIPSLVLCGVLGYAGMLLGVWLNTSKPIHD